MGIPKKSLTRGDHQISLQFNDHAGQPYTVVPPVFSKLHLCPTAIPKLSLHLYCLSDLATSAEAMGLALRDCEPILSWGNARNWWPRVDVYPTARATIEECVEHHRREKNYRRQAVLEMHERTKAQVVGTCGPDEIPSIVRKRLRGKELLPHIVPTWCPSPRFWQQQDYTTCYQRYKSFILVAPGGYRSWDDIERGGIWIVKFDQDVTPEMELDFYDDEPDMESLLSDSAGWIEVQKVEYGPVVSVERLAIREDQYLTPSMQNPGSRSSLGFDGDLGVVWQGFTTMLWDCTYRPETCKCCDENVRHENCEIEMCEHFFDEHGQCIACRRASEYRRRSKRVAKRQLERQIST